MRANYLLKGNGEFYSHSLRLWEGLERELNYNVMMSQRGVLNLAHSDGQRDAYARRGNATMPSCSTGRRCGPGDRFSGSTMRGFRSAAGCCSGGRGRRGTTRWPGASRARPMLVAST